jgi:hypothetical protein
MEQYRQSRVGWETHANKLTEIKQLINTVSRNIARLNELRSEASPQQLQEIDRIARDVRPVVANMEHILGHLRDNHQSIETCVQNDPEYKELLKSNTVLAARLAQPSR